MYKLKKLLVRVLEDVTKCTKWYQVVTGPHEAYGAEDDAWTQQRKFFLLMALAAGYYLYSPEDAVVVTHSQTIVSTDIAILVPPGTYRRIVPKSGLAVKFSIDISAGVIDLDYHGNVRILIVNHSNKVF